MSEPRPSTSKHLTMTQKWPLMRFVLGGRLTSPRLAGANPRPRQRATPKAGLTWRGYRWWEPSQLPICSPGITEDRPAERRRWAHVRNLARRRSDNLKLRALIGPGQNTPGPNFCLNVSFDLAPYQEYVGGRSRND